MPHKVVVDSKGSNEQDYFIFVKNNKHTYRLEVSIDVWENINKGDEIKFNRRNYVISK